MIKSTCNRDKKIFYPLLMHHKSGYIALVKGTRITGKNKMEWATGIILTGNNTGLILTTVLLSEFVEITLSNS